MTRRNYQVTKGLTLLTMLIETKTKELEAAGVTVNLLEEVQLEIVNLICSMNGVNRNHDRLDELCTPIFEYHFGEIGLNKCLQLFYQRLDEIRPARQRAGIDEVKRGDDIPNKQEAQQHAIHTDREQDSARCAT